MHKSFSAQREREREGERETAREGKQSILEASSPMTASVPFPNRAMIVECLVVTVLVEDADGRGAHMVCVCVRVFVCVCVAVRAGLCWKTKNSIAFVVQPIHSWLCQYPGGEASSPDSNTRG